MDSSTISSGSGLLIIFLILFFCLCCRKRQINAQNNQVIVNQPRQHRGRQRNARRKWRRRRQNDDQGRVAILDHEVTPESTLPAPGPIPYGNQPPQVHNPNNQYIINLNPPSDMPFQVGHYPGPYLAHQEVWQRAQYPAPQHVSVPLPQHAVSTPYVQQQQHQAGGFAQLYAQAQPDMNVFPSPPPPYETEPFPPLPTKQN